MRWGGLAAFLFLLATPGWGAAAAPSTGGQPEIADLEGTLKAGKDKPVPGEEAKNPLMAKDTFRRLGAITPSLEALGSVIGNPNRRMILGTGETVYIDIGADQGASKGDRFSIVTADRAIYHPTLGRSNWSGYMGWMDDFFVKEEKLGYMVRFLGTLEIVEPQSDFSEAVILEAFLPIKKGNRLIAYQESKVPERAKNYKPPAKDIQGRIVAFTETSSTIGGQQDIIYIDKGRAHDVSPGDRFEVYTIPEVETEAQWYDVWHRIWPKTKPMTPLVIGELQVVAVQENTATALVLENNRELMLGQHIRYVPR